MLRGTGWAAVAALASADFMASYAASTSVRPQPARL